MPNNSHNSLGVTPGTLPEMSETLQIPCCLPGELRGRSLVDAILEIQEKYAHKDDRPDTSDRWFRRLKCLSVYPGKEKALKRSVRNPENFSERDYIAVSYSFESAHESLNKHTLDFEIHGPGNKAPQKFKTRDIVLERVLKYAKSDAVRCQYFWIDQECFNQNNPEEHQAAMDSMDLVYKHSDFPVALLEITFGPREVYLMGILVFCDCVWPSKDDSMVAMLRHVQTDRWWQRAWTFQEEYLASTKMDILIRHTSKPGEYKKTDLTKIKGEVSISAALFRKQSTKFLSDLIERNTTSEELRKTCVSLRRTFHRYNETTDPGMGKAMSSIVFGDLERRKMSKSFDFLPIAANVCSYGIRLNSTLAQCSRRHSVGLCALAMYLLNGEIFFNDGQISVLPTEMGLSKYLDYISFDHFFSPSQEKTLSWLKKCRLRPAKPSLEGIVTSGHLWHVYKSIRVPYSGHVPDFRDDSRTVGLGRYARKILFQLVDGLEQLDACKELCDKLFQYLEDEKERRDGSSWSEDYMKIMAKEVVQAICSGRSLYLAAHEATPKACAIFVMGTDENADSDSEAESDEYGTGDDVYQSEIGCQSGSSELFGVAEENFWVFTSTSEYHHVSMTVELAETAGESESPLMTVTGWTNGLALYDGLKLNQRKDLVVRWPEAWQQRVEVEVEEQNVLKRKRSSESLRNEVA